MNRKKIGIIVAAVAAAAAIGGGAWYFLKEKGGSGSKADKVYVETVESLTAANSGSQSRYSGIVEAQETWEVNKDAEREIKEVFVKKGDMVEEGAKLFEYDMDEVASEIQQAQLELEGMQNDISNLQSQINQLTKERNSVSADEKFEYTADIQEKQNSIKQTEYNIEGKKAEIQKKQESMDKAVVTSKIAGVVKSINESGMDMMGESAAYMTILAVGDYRVKGTVSETNVQFLSEEQPVILRSRVDEEQTWAGKISKIDTQNEEQGNNNDMYYDDSSGGAEKATKYPFYVALDSTEGLMMGQHVFIELDQGQTEEKEGLWLFEAYIVQEEESAYVWADNGKNRLEKREVELGEYDENLGAYEIVSGLSGEDAIAFPMEGLYEGVATVTDISEVDYTSPLYNQEGEEGVDGENFDGGVGADGENFDSDMGADGENFDGEGSGDSGSDGGEETGEGLEDGTDPGSEDSGSGETESFDGMPREGGEENTEAGDAGADEEPAPKSGGVMDELTVTGE